MNDNKTFLSAVDDAIVAAEAKAMAAWVHACMRSFRTRSVYAQAGVEVGYAEGGFILDFGGAVSRVEILPEDYRNATANAGFTGSEYEFPALNKGAEDLIELVNAAGCPGRER